jgi:hypothetical protein
VIDWDVALQCKLPPLLLMVCESMHFCFVISESTCLIQRLASIADAGPWAPCRACTVIVVAVGLCLRWNLGGPLGFTGTKGLPPG